MSVNWNILGELLRASEAADVQYVSKAVRVTIIGMQPSEYCAFIGPLKNHTALMEKNVEYLVIPYVESTREHDLGIGKEAIW